jgi:aspartyl-tRNA(Asn)/glutamyl-tRNA(Gln) amidotransferase subunit B
MRSKEDAHDYRYFPDPDLPPLVFTQDWVESLKASLPELPDARRARYVALGLSPYDAHVLTIEKETASFFEAVLGDGRDAKTFANWLTGDFFGHLNKRGLGIEETPVGPAALAELLDLIANKTINGKIAKDVLEIMFDEGKGAAEIVDARGLRQVVDSGAIEAAVDAVLANSPGQVAQYRGGKVGLFGFFVGQTMKAMGGKGNPALVNEVLKAKLGEPGG